jgi:hypothetical protein
MWMRTPPCRRRARVPRNHPNSHQSKRMDMRMAMRWRSTRINQRQRMASTQRRVRARKSKAAAISLSCLDSARCAASTCNFICNSTCTYILAASVCTSSIRRAHACLVRLSLLTTGGGDVDRSQSRDCMTAIDRTRAVWLDRLSGACSAAGLDSGEWIREQMHTCQCPAYYVQISSMYVGSLPCRFFHIVMSASASCSDLPACSWRMRAIHRVTSAAMRTPSPHTYKYAE